MNLSNYIVSSNELKNEAHVWFCCPDEITDAEQLEYYRSLLSPDEVKQYKRFQFKNDQHSYLVSHALMRSVLSRYANLSPAQWQFKKNAHGRPEIKQSTSGVPLKFNLTHTKDLSACIVTLGMECGIDAEAVNRDNDLIKIAERMFAAPELASMENLHDSSLRKAFFKYWTLRESYVKALGTGLAGSSKDFYFCIGDNDISIEFENTMRQLNNDKEQWQFDLMEPADGHILAIAVNHSPQDKLTIVDKKTVP